MCGFIAQLVEHRTGIAEVTGSNPVEALIFFRLLLSNCLNWKIYCNDHSSLQSRQYLHFLAVVQVHPYGLCTQSTLPPIPNSIRLDKTDLFCGDWN